MDDLIAAFFHPAATWWPERLHAASAWTGHIPFAMNLVAVARPRVIVELGTHVGSSYCAMCQAVSSLDVDATCAAVDTWEGDEHAGRYGPEVLEELRQHHDPRYAAFSRLLQTTFDEALPLFADGSVDLLHIDGCHTYEAVKHDFESWLPKVSRKGVVLLHDTEERERGFGAWRFFEELRARFRCFAFTHSHGLGVVAVGEDVGAPVARLVDATEAEGAATRSLYAELGRRLDLAVELRRERDPASADQRLESERVRETERLLSIERQRADEERRRAGEWERRACAAMEAHRVAAATLESERAVAVELRREANRLRSDVAAIRGSRGWRALETWRSARDALLARAAGGREALAHGLRGMRRVVDHRR